MKARVAAAAIAVLLVSACSAGSSVVGSWESPDHKNGMQFTSNGVVVISSTTSAPVKATWEQRDPNTVVVTFGSVTDVMALKGNELDSALTKGLAYERVDHLPANLTQ